MAIPGLRVRLVWFTNAPGLQRSHGAAPRAPVGRQRVPAAIHGTTRSRKVNEAENLSRVSCGNLGTPRRETPWPQRIRGTRPAAPLPRCPAAPRGTARPTTTAPSPRLSPPERHRPNRDRDPDPRSRPPLLPRRCAIRWSIDAARPSARPRARPAPPPAPAAPPPRLSPRARHRSPLRDRTAPRACGRPNGAARPPGPACSPPKRLL